ncbi:MAG: hypothetical protein J5802_07565 [Butyrivibrio sp.]|nr:hypothetical protein [Butyrivibrio sp.]
MKIRRVTGIIAIITLLVSGCGNHGIVIDPGNDAVTTNESVTESTVTETESSEKKEDEAKVPDRFEFNPHVYSPTLAQDISQEKWDALYNLCDAVRKGESTFECANQEAYDFAILDTTLANFFPAASIRVSGESDDGSVPFENGVGKIYYKMPVDEFVAREAEFEKLIVDILNNNLETDDTDFEKCLKLYLYVAENYDYSEDQDFGGDAAFYRTFIDKKGTCVDFAAVYSYLLLQVGVDALDIGCDAQDMCHAWTYAVVGGKAYHIDTTWALKSNFEGVDGIYLDYFMMSDEGRVDSGCPIDNLTMQPLPQFFVSNSKLKLLAADETYSFPSFSIFVSLDEENKIVHYLDMDGNQCEMKYAD